MVTLVMIEMVMILMLYGEPHLVHFEQDNEQDSDQVVKMKFWRLIASWVQFGYTSFETTKMSNKTVSK